MKKEKNKFIFLLKNIILVSLEFEYYMLDNNEDVYKIIIILGNNWIKVLKNSNQFSLNNFYKRKK